MQTLKKYCLSVSICLLMLPTTIMAQDMAPQPAQIDQSGGVTLQTFYDQLAPYGQWVNWPNYGYVFIPSVAPGFTPYSTSGHWVYDNTYGWMWASDYPWGWAAFHYGRWNYDANYGWFWIPDLNWGPAWVVWRNCTGYYGWAPLPWGVQINVGFGDYNIAPEHWCFVPQEHICEVNLGAWFIPRTHNDAFIRHSVVIDRMDYDNAHRFGYFKGPDRAEVEGYIHRPVVVVHADDYRRVPARVVVHNDDRHVEEQHVNEQRHDDHQAQNMERHDEHAVQNQQRHDNHPEERSAPARYVEQHDVPQRGRH